RQLREAIAGIGLIAVGILELDRALVGAARLVELADCLSGAPEPAPVPAPGRRDLDVVAQVPVGLVMAPELEQRVAECEVSHRVAHLETGAPEIERVLAALAGGRVEVDPIHRGFPTEMRPRGDDD